jgi:hypothetical protein
MAKHNSRTSLEGKEWSMKAYWRWSVYVFLAGGLLFSLVGRNDSRATEAEPCPGLPTAEELKAVLMQVVPGGFEANGGVGAPEWLTLVDSSGMVCAVVHSVALTDPDDVTSVLAIAHRPYSAQKAGMANGFSRGPVGLATGIGVSTAQLNYSARTSFPSGNELSAGLGSLNNAHINPFGGEPRTWGTRNDPYIGQRFGADGAVPGGLPLFDASHRKVGAIGVSGDFRCTDHVVAWKVRELLRDGAYTFTNIPFGLSQGFTGQDQMELDVDPRTGISAGTYGYPDCGFNAPTNANDGGSIIGN